MTSTIRIIVFLLFAVSLLSACSTWNKLDRTERGAVIGGGTGVAVGNMVSPGVGGTVIGGALGAVGGGVIGRETDDDDDKK
jgi:uncharacterized protein YcfJ